MMEQSTTDESTKLRQQSTFSNPRDSEMKDHPKKSKLPLLEFPSN